MLQMKTRRSEQRNRREPSPAYRKFHTALIIFVQTALTSRMPGFIGQTTLVAVMNRMMMV